MKTFVPVLALAAGVSATVSFDPALVRSSRWLTPDPTVQPGSLLHVPGQHRQQVYRQAEARVQLGRP